MTSVGPIITVHTVESAITTVSGSINANTRNSAGFVDNTSTVEPKYCAPASIYFNDGALIKGLAFIFKYIHNNKYRHTMERYTLGDVECNMITQRNDRNKYIRKMIDKYMSHEFIQKMENEDGSVMYYHSIVGHVFLKYFFDSDKNINVTFYSIPINSQCFFPYFTSLNEEISNVKYMIACCNQPSRFAAGIKSVLKHYGYDVNAFKPQTTSTLVYTCGPFRDDNLVCLQQAAMLFDKNDKIHIDLRIDPETNTIILRCLKVMFDFGWITPYPSGAYSVMFRFLNNKKRLAIVNEYPTYAEDFHKNVSDVVNFFTNAQA